MSNEISYRYGASLTVEFPDFPSFDSVPHNVRIYQEAGKQDVVEITYPHFSSFYQRAFRTGTLVRILWNNKKVSGQFFGYVFEVESTSQVSTNQPTIVRCISASFHLKQGGTKIWTKRTASEIVGEIAKKFKLSSDITPSKVRYTQQSLSGQSYWQKIQELAYISGFVSHMYGTNLHFHPLDIMINKFMGSVPILSFETWTVPDLDQAVSHTLDSFKPRTGDLSASTFLSRKEKQVWAIDPVTAKIFKATKSPSASKQRLRKNTRNPIFTENLPTLMASSKNMLDQMTEAQAILSRFNTFADGSAPGDPRISPYKTVEVRGTGVASDGFWVVTKTEHFITHDGRYYTDFSCMTDGSGENATSAFRPPIQSGVPIRNVAYESLSGLSSKPSSTKLSATTLLFNESESGLAFNQRRWVGR